MSHKVPPLKPNTLNQEDQADGQSITVPGYSKPAILKAWPSLSFGEIERFAADHCRYRHRSDPKMFSINSGLLKSLSLLIKKTRDYYNLVNVNAGENPQDSVGRARE
jgi:hypothetical protein